MHWLDIHNTSLYAYYFDKSAYHDSLFSDYKISMPETIQRSVNGRKAEFLAGRCSAHKALAKLKIEVPSLEIKPDRSTKWPKGVVASISHSGDTAMCIAARSEHHAYLGVDIEQLISSSLIANIESSIINSAERDRLSTTSMPYSAAFTIAFSAKESLYKALYPSVARIFDFDAVELLFIDEINKTLGFKIIDTLNQEFTSGTRVNGIYNYDEQQVLTCIYKPNVSLA